MYSYTADPTRRVETGVSKNPLAGMAGPFTPDWASLDTRANPKWHEQARFGIKIHWGPYAVPGWGPVDPSYDHSGLCDEKVTGGSCYAEQYERFYRNPSHPTHAFHNSAYGKDADYQDVFFPGFRPYMYNATEWAALFRDAGAQYVYMTWKHSDGFALGAAPLRYESDSDPIAHTKQVLPGARWRWLISLTKL